MNRRTLLLWAPSLLFPNVLTEPVPIVGPSIGSIVGTWDVNVVGAPFPAHLFTFSSDGTLLQVNPDANPTNDSDGLGIWRFTGREIQGKFKEISADRTSHQYVSFLVVTFSVTIHANTFAGPATATVHAPDGTILFQRDTYLEGTRMQFP